MLPSAVSDSRVHNILPNRIDTDFQFSRASAATRVNHQGLIENVGYFSDELVRNGNFSELGPELITNGDFATDSNWTKGDGWSISNGKAVANNVTNNLLSQTGISFIANKTYKLVYTISDYVSGSVRPQLSGGGNPVQNLETRNKNGTFTQYFVANAASINFRFKGFTNFTGKIDNVSLKQVDPDDDWSVGVAWDITDKGNFDDTLTSAIYQSGLTLTSGKKYKLTFTISDASANANIWIGNSVGNVNYEGLSYRAFTNGNHITVFDMPSNQSTLAFYGNTSGTSFSIDNISLVEVQGDRPRLDYDPINPTCPHLLLEPQSTNSFKFSEDFAQSYWFIQGGGTVNSNQTISPEGIQNADTLVSANATSEQYIYNSTLISVTSGDDVTISCFVKKLDYDYFHLRFTATGGVFTAASAWYNISNGTLGTVEAGITAKIEDYGNGWYRCSATRTATGTGSGRVRLQLASADNTAFVTGDGTKGTFVYGAQFEIQSYPTSYIPTAGVTGTRVAETCTSAGNANTFNSTEGVLYAEIAALADDLTFRSISINNGTDNEAVVIRFRTTTNRINGLIRDGGSAVNNLNFDVTDIRDFHKVAYKFKTGDCALFIDGVQVQIGTQAFTLSQLSSVDFDKGGNTGDFFYGKTKSLATYNRALTDTELYTITSTQYSAYSGMVAALGNYTIPC